LITDCCGPRGRIGGRESLLASSCGWLEPISLPDLLPRFRLVSIPLHPFVLQPALLEQIA